MDLEVTRAFVKVVQMGSFTKAALALRLPKSSVSRMVSRLESDTGTQLLVRTTRNLTLTAAGRGFYESCLGPLHQLEEARKSLSGKDSMLTGLVRITAPEDMGSIFIAPCVADITRRNPGLYFDLVYTEERLDLVRDGIDLAVRIGKLDPSQFKAKRVGDVVLGLVASPGYVAKQAKITKPADLLEHPCFSFTPRSSTMKWHLTKGRQSQTVPVQSRVLANQMSTLQNLALAGAGVALAPLYLCQRDLDAGRLVRVLPDWDGTSFAVSVVSPASISASARVKLVRDQLISEIEKKLKRM